MNRQTPHLILALAILATPTLAQTALSADAWKTIVTKRSFHDKVTVNGEPVDRNEVVRTLVYRAPGYLLERKLLALAAEAEIDRRITAGDAKDYTIGDDQVLAEVERRASRIGDATEFWKGRSIEEERRRVVSYLRYASVFFPSKRNEWPGTTIAAVKSLSRGTALLAHLGARRDGGGDWATILRGALVRHLARTCTVRFGADGLPANVCMTVDGARLRTRDALRELGEYERSDRALALAEVAIEMALRQALAKRGCLLEPPEVTKAFEKRVEGELAGCSPWSDALLRGYPTLAIYRQRLRLVDSFEKLIRAEITDDALEAHLRQRADVLSGSDLEVEWIRIPFAGNRAEQAVRSATQIADAIRTGKLSFSDARKQHPVWPPTSLRSRMTYAEVRGLLGESEYTDFLARESRADKVFWARPKQVVGPIRGRDAVFVARVHQLRSAARTPSLRVPRVRREVRDDYVMQRFLAWARRIAAKIVIR